MTDSSSAQGLAPASQETGFRPFSGWFAVVGLLAWLAAVTAFDISAVHDDRSPIVPVIVSVVSLVSILVCLAGFFIVNPNQSSVLILFGRYRGSVRQEGFYWTNPFTSKTTVSLRAHNLASETIKVNDLVGNPIEIGAVIVWQVRDTAQASLDVEDYRNYVDVQIETAIRQLANEHPYDDGHGPADVSTLRGDTAEMGEKLRIELQKRLDRAGIHVIEARLSHLAYAPEIASAMLQRQQASAVVAAREKIVEGAVGMVEQALSDLSSRRVLELDDERRATLVGNLLVVLCGNSQATPVVNTGTLYN